MSTPLDIELQFEPDEFRPARGPLVAFAEEAYHLACANPLAIPDALCGQASRVASGILVPERCLHENEGLRLCSIKHGNTDLLRRDYDEFGRLTGVSYPDGIRVAGQFNERDRLCRVACSKGPQIAFSWDPFGNLTEKQVVPGARKFAFTRNEVGQLERLATPAGQVKWSWRNGTLLSVQTGDGVRVEFDRTGDGVPATVTVASNGESVKVDLSAKEHPVHNRPSAKGGREMLSPLGFMRFDGQDRVVFWLSATGDPIWFHHDAEGRIVQVWTAAGPNLIEYGNNGSFALLNANGDRFLLWPVDKEKFLMIGPEGVACGKWLSGNRPASVLGMWGDSTVFSYGLMNRSKLPVAVDASQSGKLDLRHTKASGLESLDIGGTGNIEFTHTRGGALQSITLVAPSTTSALAILRLAGFSFAVRSAGESGFASFFLWGRHIQH